MDIDLTDNEARQTAITALMERLGKFLETPILGDHGGGWPVVPREVEEEFYAILYDIRDLKIERDGDGDAVIQFDSVNRKQGYKNWAPFLYYLHDETIPAAERVRTHQLAISAYLAQAAESQRQLEHYLPRLIKQMILEQEEKTWVPGTKLPENFGVKLITYFDKTPKGRQITDVALAFWERPRDNPERPGNCWKLQGQDRRLPPEQVYAWRDFEYPDSPDLLVNEKGTENRPE